MMEKMLPHSTNTELCLLGILLTDEEAVGEITSLVQPKDFYHDAHRLIYETILELDNSNIPVNSLTVQDSLDENPAWQEQNNSVFTSINEALFASRSSLPLPYAQRVLQLSEAREVIWVASDIVALAYSGIDNARERAFEKLTEVEGSRVGRNEMKETKEIVEAYMDGISNRVTGGKRRDGIPTGFDDVDNMIGGFRPGNLIVLAARPGMGKSAIAAQIAINAASRGHRGCVVSLEMDTEELAERLLSNRAMINSMKLARLDLTNEDLAKLNREADWLSDLPLVWADPSTVTTASLRAMFRREIQKRGKLDFAVVDYLQLMEGTSQSRSSNRVQEVTEISRNLKIMAREFDMPIIALAQLNRAVEQRAVKIPQLSDLRESGSIEQDANMVIFLYREDFYNPECAPELKNTCSFIVEKNRRGPRGSIQLAYTPEFVHFANLEIPTTNEE